MEIQRNYSLKKYNTFNFDVKARNFIEINNEEELKLLLSDKDINNMPILMLGQGSNILFRNDFDGLVIKLKNQDISVINEDDTYVYVKVGGGVIWDNFVDFAVSKNYGGVENLSLIPGTVGAAPIQNIGAYGQEVKDTVFSIKGYEISSINEKLFMNSECKFGYRSSIFKHELRNKFIITEVIFRLSKLPILNINYGRIKSELEKLPKNDYSIADVREAVINIRQSKLPDTDKIGNAGSFFKNPEISEIEFIAIQKINPQIPFYNTAPDVYKIPAGWLIEQCGWKGKRFGDAGCYTEQALILCNYGSAQPNEIIKLAALIKKSVYEKFGIAITEEVNII